MDPCERVRVSCARVASHPACGVAIDEAALRALAERLGKAALARAAPGAGSWDACGWHGAAAIRARGGDEALAQYVLVVDALNFCFWPSAGAALEYEHLACGLRDAFLADPGCFAAERLAACCEADLRRWVAAPCALPALEERVARVREVGEVLLARFGGSALALCREARHSAVELVRLVTAHFPGFCDEAVFAPDGRPVYFYKRAQIFAADVWGAFGCAAHDAAAAPGAPAAHACAFADVGRLTMFADYRVPQLLRAAGVLVYAPALAARVDAREELPAQGADEVAVRAATVVAVERARALIAAAAAGEPRLLALTSVELDWLLWDEGEARKDEIAPHHRTRTIFY